MTPAPKRTAFYEILVEGQPERVHGLLTGLALGSDSPGRMFFTDEAGVKTPLGEKVLEFVHLHAGVCHVIVDSVAHGVLKTHTEALAEQGMRIMEQKRIRSARFEFEYHAYARQYAQEIQALFQSLPKGLKLQGGKPEETIHDEAAGMEAYSPAHHYEVEAEGVLSSSQVDLVIEARRTLGDHPLVNVRPIELKLY